MSVELRTSQDMLMEIAGRFKERRLALNLTQEGVAARSGVSWSSLKRFERTGLVALDSLLKVALVLNCLSDFDKLASDNSPVGSGKSLDDILSEPRAPKKGRIK